MKKILALTLTALTAALLLCSCNNIDDAEVDNNIENSDGNTSDESSEEKEDVRDKAVDTSTVFVLDNAGLLSDSEYSELNEYAAWLSKYKKINACVATTDDIGEQTSEEYASDYYSNLYGNSNGVMFLVNNDNGEDYILRKGITSEFLTNSDINMLFSEISPSLVKGDYKNAISSVLDYFSNSLPEFAIDRTNSFDKEELSEINSSLSDACSENEGLSIIFIGDIGDKNISEYANEQAEKYLDCYDNSALMIVNTKTAEYYVSGSGNFEGLTESQASIKSSVEGCLTKNDEENLFNGTQLADIFINFAGK